MIFAASFSFQPGAAAAAAAALLALSALPTLPPSSSSESDGRRARRRSRASLSILPSAAFFFSHARFCSRARAKSVSGASKMSASLISTLIGTVPSCVAVQRRRHGGGSQGGW